MISTPSEVMDKSHLMIFQHIQFESLRMTVWVIRGKVNIRSL